MRIATLRQAVLDGQVAVVSVRRVASCNRRIANRQERPLGLGQLEVRLALHRLDPALKDCRGQ